MQEHCCAVHPSRHLESYKVPSWREVPHSGKGGSPLESRRSTFDLLDANLGPVVPFKSLTCHKGCTIDRV